MQADRFSRLHSNAFLAIAGAVALGWLSARMAGVDPASGTLFVPVLAVVALLAGLPHGAMDFVVSRHAGLWTNWRECLRWHVGYLLIAGAVVAGFVLAPAVTLLLFLALSVVHFADDWQDALSRPLRITAGALIVLVPSVAHPEEVVAIFTALTGSGPKVTGPLPYAVWLTTGWLAAGVAMAAFVADRRAGVEIAVLVALAVALPPLAFFFVYFAMLHSPRHMLHERAALSQMGGLGSVALYTVVSFALCIGVVAYVFEDRATSILEDDAMLRVLFIGLAALTFPHAVLIERVNT